jgi:hypothetical protein
MILSEVINSLFFWFVLGVGFTAIAKLVLVIKMWWYDRQNNTAMFNEAKKYFTDSD